jgi:histidine ammonia-lyase
MATFAARRLLAMTENTLGIVAIELLAACQGIDFRRPLKTSKKLEAVFGHVRSKVKFYDKDRFFAPDIEAVKKSIRSGEIARTIEEDSFA